MKYIRIVFFVFVGLAGLSLTNLKNDNSIEAFFVKSSPSYQQYQDFVKKFGFDETHIFGVCGDLKQEGVRKMVERFTNDLKKIPHVAHVISPLDFLNSSDPLKGRALAEDSGFWKEGMESFPIYLFFDEKVKENRTETYKDLKQIRNKWQGEFSCVHMAGQTILNASLNSSGEEVGKKFFPVLLIFTVIFLWLLYRNVIFVIAPLIAVTTSEILTAGIITACGIPFSLVLTLIPTMVFIFTLSSSIHIQNHFMLLYRRRLKGEQTLLSEDEVDALLWQTYQEKKKPLIFTLITTGLGFLSLALSSIEPVRNLGIFTAIGCLMIGLSVWLVLPPLLRWCHLGKKGMGIIMIPATEHFIPVILEKLVKFRYFLTTACLLFVIGAAFIVPKLPVETNALNYYPESNPLKSDFVWMEKNITGMSPVNLLINRYHDQVSEDNFIKLVGESKEVLTVLHDENFGFLDAQHFFSGGQERIILLTKYGDATTLNGLKEEVQNAAKKTGIGKVIFTGQHPLLLESQEEIINTLVKSLLMAILVIGAALFLIVRDIPLTLAAGIPNLASIFAVFFFMYFLNIPIDITTVTVATVALGIAVDDTIHLIVHYKEERDKNMDFMSAMKETLEIVSLPVIYTTILVAVGFSVFLLSDFLPVNYFGGLMSLTMISALILDLFITPAAIRLLHR